jgi:hypothetical protein
LQGCWGLAPQSQKGLPPHDHMDKDGINSLAFPQDSSIDPGQCPKNSSTSWGHVTSASAL